ncbi:methionyl-tRNA formyltransferase [Halorientalis pallida]|uniref:methionyl-tRNA formyltransferase n=1 Tax=Halorientalis pallida TaxID=2479928 RepID=UPI003C6F3BA5
MDIVFVTHNELGRRCIHTLADLGGTISAIYTRTESERISDQISFDQVAAETNSDLHEVESVNEAAVVDRIEQYAPDLLFVVGWSQLVNQRVIEIPSVAALGMHPTPLPRGRGRAPVAWNLIKGYERTKLSLFELEEEADAGQIYGQHEITIDERDDAQTLNQKIYEAGERLLRSCYPRIEDGSIAPSAQDDAEATWWPRRRPHHGLIDWNRSARDLHNWIRGQTHPYPGAFTHLHDTRVTIWSSEPPTGEKVFAKPGEIIAVRGDNLAVAAWEEVIELRTVQIEDGDEVPASELIENDGFDIGAVFENARDRLVDT